MKWKLQSGVSVWGDSAQQQASSRLQTLYACGEIMSRACILCVCLVIDTYTTTPSFSLQGNNELSKYHYNIIHIYSLPQAILAVYWSPDFITLRLLGTLCKPYSLLYNMLYYPHLLLDIFMSSYFQALADYAFMRISDNISYSYNANYKIT